MGKIRFYDTKNKRFLKKEVVCSANRVMQIIEDPNNTINADKFIVVTEDCLIMTINKFGDLSKNKHSNGDIKDIQNVVIGNYEEIIDVKHVPGTSCVVLCSNSSVVKNKK